MNLLQRLMFMCVAILLATLATEASAQRARIGLYACSFYRADQSPEIVFYRLGDGVVEHYVMPGRRWQSDCVGRTCNYNNSYNRFISIQDSAGNYVASFDAQLSYSGDDIYGYTAELENDRRGDCTPAQERDLP